MEKKRAVGEMAGSLSELEAVRSRLAIAIAADSQRTPPGQRRGYLETADRMRQCVQKYKRGVPRSLSPKGNWLVKRILGDTSLEGDARRFCRIVGNIIEELEGGGCASGDESGW